MDILATVYRMLWAASIVTGLAPSALCAGAAFADNNSISLAYLNECTQVVPPGSGVIAIICEQTPGLFESSAIASLPDAAYVTANTNFQLQDALISEASLSRTLAVEGTGAFAKVMTAIVYGLIALSALGVLIIISALCRRK